MRRPRLRRPTAPGRTRPACHACGTSPPRRARWCPRCGAALDAAGSTRRRGPWAGRPRVGGTALAVVVAVALAGVVATTSTSLHLPWPRAGDTARTAAPGVRDTPTDPAVAARTDPHTVSVGAPQRAAGPPAVCRPEGCIAWQRALDGELAAAGGAHVYLHDGYAIEALDAVTGASRWRAELDDLIDADDRNRLIGGFAGQLTPSPLVPTDDGVLVVAPGRATWVDADGQRRWIHRLRGYTASDAVVQGGQVLLHTRNPRGSGPLGQLQALDATTGEPRWTRNVAAVHLDRRLPESLPRHLGTASLPDDAPVLVSATRRRLAALDPHTGEVVWSRPLGKPPARIERRGDVVWHVQDGRSRVLRLVDGTPHPLASYRPTIDLIDELPATATTLPGSVRWHRDADGRGQLDHPDGDVEVLDPTLALLGSDPPVIGDTDRVVGLSPAGGG